ncbi:MULTISPECIES: diacylglycerol kinase family protein [unclassified Pseudofrankia]|uniref:diacylglycerol/lipid kinase family protein n=1 Tax=unclassified Pseudofrankia TaxID=2994372 RepID=UPI0008DAE8BC|nr:MULTISPECIES: diacylglycerol kinase family protein [unclassified Pseudofrankia]MDT3441141.1 diacylglycerol kinase family protein [Pseudofrankia sp. BMG5.37]OHV54260.1 diacylglycerol kinase [Pseudofrankia sp. BMG5.36]
MRGLLVVNPAATTTTERVRDVLVTALSADVAVETVITKGRGHAAELGQRASETGVDVVIALGGDGTVNEVVNGLLHGGPRPDAPALAVVPGGSTNVFARALGYSASPVEATGELLANLRDGRTRLVGLGHARWAGEARWFTFCAGMGLDAEVVGRVERRRSGGRPNSAGLFLRSAVARYGRGIGRDRVGINLELEAGPEIPRTAAETQDGAEESAATPDREVTVAIVCNAVPWTYLGGMPVRACPEASFDTGLDLLGLRRARLSSLLRTTGQMLAGDRGPHGRNVVLEHDLTRIRMTAAPTAPFQMDGEYLGEHAEVELTAHPQALRVIAAV